MHLLDEVHVFLLLNRRVYRLKCLISLISGIDIKGDVRMLPESGLNGPLYFKITDLSICLLHWPVSPRQGASSVCRCKRRFPDVGISCRYIEFSVAEDRRAVVFQL